MQHIQDAEHNQILFGSLDKFISQDNPLRNHRHFVMKLPAAAESEVEYKRIQRTHKQTQRFIIYSTQFIFYLALIQSGLKASNNKHK